MLAYGDDQGAHAPRMQRPCGGCAPVGQIHALPIDAGEELSLGFVGRDAVRQRKQLVRHLAGGGGIEYHLAAAVPGKAHGALHRVAIDLQLKQRHLSFRKEGPHGVHLRVRHGGIGIGGHHDGVAAVLRHQHAVGAGGVLGADRHAVHVHAVLTHGIQQKLAARIVAHLAQHADPRAQARAHGGLIAALAAGEEAAGVAGDRLAHAGQVIRPVCSA